MGGGMLMRTTVPACAYDQECFVAMGDYILFLQEATNFQTEPYASQIAFHQISTGETTLLEHGYSDLVADGDVAVTATWEYNEGRDFTGNGNAEDWFVRWHRPSSRFSSEPIVGNSPSVRGHWIAVRTSEPELGADLDGDGELNDAAIRLIDTRDGRIHNTGISGGIPQVGARAVFFHTFEESAGDLNGDGDTGDYVIQWMPLPDAVGLPPGVHNTGANSNRFVVSDDDLVAFFSSENDTGQDLDGNGLIDTAKVIRAYWAPSQELYNTGSISRGVDKKYFAVDGATLAYSRTDGQLMLRDFATRETTETGFYGLVWNLQGKRLDYWFGEWNPINQRWDQALAYMDLVSQQHYYIGATTFDYPPRFATAGDVFYWSVDPRQNACYPSPAPSVHYYRYSTDASFQTGMLSELIGSSPPPPSRLLPVIERERLYRTDLNPGVGGTGQTFLSFYVYPCEDFGDLEEHLGYAEPGSWRGSGRLERAARRARRFFERGRPRQSARQLCALQDQIGNTPELAQPARRMLAGCVNSLASSLGLSDSEGLCGAPDNCPGLANPMQDDLDDDSVGGACDNCSFRSNTGQEDSDGDGYGNACDNCPFLPDAAPGVAEELFFDCQRWYYEDGPNPAEPPGWSDCDHDGVGFACDNCGGISNPDQQDSDSDGVGDACQHCHGPQGQQGWDSDEDGVTDCTDNCTYAKNPGQQDGDRDTVGDSCDNCATIPNTEQPDADEDRIGDACDLDDDDDGVPDDADPCPLWALDDEDGDGVCGNRDTCPAVADPAQADADQDTRGDACDNCPNDGNADQRDADRDLAGDACDSCLHDAGNDVDGDGLCADQDNCDLLPNPGQEDRDGDPYGDPCDFCPDTANEVETDYDFDGVGDACDNCVRHQNSDQLDSDGDLLGDSCDACPLDSEDDWDGDGHCADADNCPAVANVDQMDSDQDGVGDACEGP